MVFKLKALGLVLLWSFSFCIYGDELISCKDEGRKNVDWWIAYKIPPNPESTEPSIQSGAAYFYLTPHYTDGWQRSFRLMNNADSILGISTDPLYRNLTTNFAYVLYNDQSPVGESVTRNGHTKGIVMASNSSAVWLVHSVPHFPKLGSTFGYPPGGLQNGQLFLCLTLNLTQVDRVGTALQYTKPNIFNASISDSFTQLLPKLYQVVNKNATRKSAPWFTSFKLETGGLDFSVFVKGPKFRKEIFADWIAPEFQTGLDVQSWLNGAHPFQSNCTSANYSVLNILSKDIEGQNFTTHNDHSKWAVGIEKPSVCVSDLNRMKPQKTRGGVALCVTNEKIWTAFKKSVEETQPCNSTIPRFDKYFRIM